MNQNPVRKWETTSFISSNRDSILGAASVDVGDLTDPKGHAKALGTAAGSHLCRRRESCRDRGTQSSTQCQYKYFLKTEPFLP